MRLDLPLRQTSVLRFGEETLEPRVGSESVAANVKAVTRPDRAVLGSYFQVFPVAMSEGPHPIPSRTRKLSPPEPMVLHAKVCGRVGRCRVNSRTPHLVFFEVGRFLFPSRCPRQWPIWPSSWTPARHPADRFGVRSAEKARADKLASKVPRVCVCPSRAKAGTSVRREIRHSAPSAH